ncbi:MAG: hypothetical protein IT317_00615 [Anaerolineales bacterium]|nr:hypothetical protein [Anaerolineales bacterium]
MTPTYIRYPLADGYLHHWLVAGPQAQPAAPASAESELALLQRLHTPASGVTEPVVDLGPLTTPAGEARPLTWRYYRTLDDHLVDLTADNPAYSHLTAWAYAQVQVPAAVEVSLIVSAHGPVDVWVNGQALLPVAQYHPRFIHSAALTAAFQPGANEILVRFEALGSGPVRHALALRLPGLTAAEITLPTNIEPGLIERRQIAEYVAYSAVTDRYVFGNLGGDKYDKNQPIPVTFPADVTLPSKLTLRLQSPDAKIYQEAATDFKGGDEVELAKTFPLMNGLHHLTFGPLAHEYYQKSMRFERHEPFYVVRAPYTIKAGPDYSARAKEALADAAARRGDSVYTELAKMASALWDKVDFKLLQRKLAAIAANAGEDAVFDLLGLLGFLLRYPSKKKQSHLKELRPALQAAALAFRYWLAADNGHAAGAAADFSSEHRQLAYHTAEILAGQLWPEAVFAVSGQTGAWHQAHGEGLALAWLRRRGGLGFEEWNAPLSLEANVVSLTHLLDLAAHEAVAELAAVLLDKLCFSLAVNSFQGAYTGTQGRATTESVLSARLAATTGLARLLWGQGNFTQHVRGLVSLACCREYQLPELIRQIATEPVDALWNQERHVRPAAGRPAVGDLAAPAAPPAWDWDVNTVTYKTKNFMLSCAQDYHPGQPGRREHIWQATFGPDAVVFVNHPTTLALDDAHQPNLWVGNGVLPRAAQWGDVLISVHQLPADDWLGFTHAYFPVRAFDEHAFQGQWAFARLGNGYLALTAARGFSFVTAGPTAYRELRSPGPANVWVLHLGQALLDGAFADFQQKILALDLAWSDAGARLTSLRGDRLAFGWTGPLLVNDEAQALVHPRHIENPYGLADLPAAQMDVIFKGEGLRLKFG